MSAQHHSADTDTDGPDQHGQPQHHVHGLDHTEDGAHHHSPGGVAGRETELVHHLHRGKLIINIVGGAAASCEGFDNSHDNNVKYQSKKQVKEEGWAACVESGDGNKEPGNSCSQ